MKCVLVVFLLAGAVSAQSPAAPEFEVAAIHQLPPYDGKPFRVVCSGGPGTQDPELFTCQNMSLMQLVEFAWHADPNRLVEPDWMRAPFPWFNLSATIPANTTREQFQLMLQNLLTDRFKLSLHHENRETAQFDLVVDKGGPKFKPSVETPPAEGGSNSASADAPAPQLTRDQNGFPAFNGCPMDATMNGKARLYQPRMTIKALAARLSRPLRAPVSDATGLTGDYEIHLYWVMDAGLRAAAPTADAGPTLVQALQEQLGLRLESKKGQADFLVIDHAEKVPTEN